MNKHAAIRTDLAREARLSHPALSGVSEKSGFSEEFEWTRIDVTTDRAAKKLDKPKGRYIGITMPKSTLTDREARARCAALAARELSALLPDGETLVIGLGNRYITPDALGTKAAESVLVTRHIKNLFGDVLPENLRSVASFCTGVLGATGLETVEVVSALTAKLRPKSVLVIDSLAAGDVSHLGTVLQMNDTGIAPGAGIGNRQTALNRRTLGVPVIALGIPLVISAETLARGENGEAGEPVWEDFSVTPKDIDLLVMNGAKLLCETIDRALYGKDAEILRNLLQ